MRKVKVLLLGVGGNVSQGILKTLRRNKMEDVDIEIIGACIASDSLGLYMCDKGYICPYADSEEFMPWLTQICNTEKIDLILTGVEENIYKIEKCRKELEDHTDAVFISCNMEQLQIGGDKYKTCEWLRKNGCNYPDYCLPEDTEAVEQLINNYGFPLIAKPRIGKGSAGVKTVHTIEEIRDILNQDYVLEECVGTKEDEYTVGCYCDKTGALRDIIILHRKLRNGATAWAKVVENENIRKEAIRICEAFNPKGPLNIQMRISDKGRPVCFELNVRFSGTTAIRDYFGFKDVKAQIKEYILEQDIEDCFNIGAGEVYRYTEELYLPAGITEKMEQDKKIEDINCDKGMWSI